MTDPAPPARTRRLSRAARQEQLLTVAEQLFLTGGYEYTSIEDICRAAGITRPVVYDHYGSKEGIYLACVRRARVRYERDLILAFEGTANPREQLERSARVYFGMIEDDPQRWLLFYSGVAVPPTGELGQQLQDLRLQTHLFVVGQLRRHAPGQPDMALEAAAAALSGMFEQLGLWWLRRPELSRAEVMRLACDLGWNGPLRMLLGEEFKRSQPV